MSLKSLKFKIEGDFVDSFIYSGCLFLVDIDYRLSTYKWDQIIRSAFDPRKIDESIKISSILEDSRIPIMGVEKKEITVSSKKLKEHMMFNVDLGVWPSDINIYANKLYVSSEVGVSVFSLDYRRGTLSQEFKIFEEMCFSLAPNSYDRLAFAAGNLGAFIFIPTSSHLTKRFAKQLIDKPCVDVDWASNYLFAKTSTGIAEAKYQPIPKKGEEETKNEFFKRVNEAKLGAPRIGFEDNLDFAWIAGNKIFKLNKDLQIDISLISAGEEVHAAKCKLDERVIRARTAAFGTLVETEKKLLSIVNGEAIEIDESPVSWRVFPRAKNYANQIHLIKDDYMEIDILQTEEINEYGFDAEEIGKHD